MCPWALCHRQCHGVNPHRPRHPVGRLAWDHCRPHIPGSQMHRIDSPTPRRMMMVGSECAIRGVEWWFNVNIICGFVFVFFLCGWCGINIVHGSAASLLSGGSSLYGSAEERQANEVRRLKRELCDARDQVMSLSSQLSTNVSLILNIYIYIFVLAKPIYISTKKRTFEGF